MGRGGYYGGSTVIGPGSSWFSKLKPKKKPKNKSVNPGKAGSDISKKKVAKARSKLRVLENEAARVSRDLRIVVHKVAESVLLAYVAHHDDAYGWAERRRIERHPRTGVIQIVEVRELVEEIAAPARQLDLGFEVEPIAAAPAQDDGKARAPLFATLERDQLLSVGVPEDWLADVLSADEDGFLGLSEHLPPEASEALLEFATSGILKVPEPQPVAADPYAHPDAQRRFRVIEN